VVADRHDVIADGLHELGLGRALVGGVEQRALERIPGIEDKHVVAQRRAHLVDLGLDPSHAAKAFALRFAFGVAGRIEPVDRFDTAVNVVGVQDVQREIGGGDTGGQAKHSGAGQQSGKHGSLPC